MYVLKSEKHRSLEGGPSFTLMHRARRSLWNLTWTVLASWTPPPLHRWRAFLLRLFGADISASARVYGSAKVWYPPNLTMEEYAVLGPNAKCYCMGRVHIGSKAVVSQGAHICAGTHDISDPHFQLIVRPIFIGDRAWVAADAFIGPGVTVGQGAVVGARAVLFKDAEPWGVYVGNPARLVKTRVLRSS